MITLHSIVMHDLNTGVEYIINAQTFQWKRNLVDLFCTRDWTKLSQKYVSLKKLKVF